MFGEMKVRKSAMKKLFLLCLIVMSLSSVCFAEIAQNRVAIGGIHWHDSLKRVKSILGEPTKILYNKGSINGESPRDMSWIQYGKKFNVFFLVREDVAVDIQTSNPIYATPDGVSPGMAATTLTEVYGKADRVRQAHGGTLYSYFSKTADGEYNVLEFDVRNGLIYQIEIHIKH